MSRWPFKRKQPPRTTQDPLSLAQTIVSDLLQFTPDEIAKAASTRQGRQQLAGVIQELRGQLSIIEPLLTDLRGIVQRLEAAIASAEQGLDA